MHNCRMQYWLHLDFFIDFFETLNYWFRKVQNKGLHVAQAPKGFFVQSLFLWVHACSYSIRKYIRRQGLLHTWSSAAIVPKVRHNNGARSWNISFWSCKRKHYTSKYASWSGTLMTEHAIYHCSVQNWINQPQSN